MSWMYKCGRCEGWTQDGAAACQHCGQVFVDADRVDYYGQVRPPDPSVIAHIRSSSNQPVPAHPFVAPPSAGVSREVSTVITIAGAVVLLLGLLRWNSLESQLLRGIGQGDALGVMLLVVGIGALIAGSVLLLKPKPPERGQPDPPPQSSTLEARLRQLEDLKAKGLITDDEHRRRREELLASL